MLYRETWLLLVNYDSLLSILADQKLSSSVIICLDYIPMERRPSLPIIIPTLEKYSIIFQVSVIFLLSLVTVNDFQYASLIMCVQSSFKITRI